MKWVLAASCVLAAGSGSAFCQQVKLPAEVRGAPGSYIQVQAVTDCPEVSWYSPTPGLNLFPTALLKDTKTAVVTGAAGRYKLVAVAAKDSKPSPFVECVVVIGDAGPDPTPDPTPGPSDPLVVALKAAFDREPADQRIRLADVAGVYAAAAKAVPAATVWGDVFKAISDENDKAKTLGVLVGVKQAIAAELRRALPTKDAGTLPIDEAGKALAAKTLVRIAKALGEVK
jgi:hypothetical protein